MERTTQEQMGRAPQMQVTVLPGQQEQADIGLDWFNSFEEKMYPQGVAKLDAATYACVDRAARHYRNQLGLKLRWLSPHTFSYRAVKIVQE